MEKQKTIKSEVKIKGVGLHTGDSVNVVLRPADENEGVTFRRIDLAGMPEVKARPENILNPDARLQRTSIKRENAEIYTIEHFMAALSGVAVDNVLIDVDGAELPGLDGSAKDFVDALLEAEFVEQNAPKTFIEIKEPVMHRNEFASIEVLPDSDFKIDYFLEFNNHPWIKKQSFSISVDKSPEFLQFFQNELAPSRTFCLEEEAMALLKAGLGKGANFENTLVMGKNGPLNNELRFPDELAKHKILDLLGDLYLLGGHIKGHVIAKKSGHQLNAIFVKEIGKKVLIA